MLNIDTCYLKGTVDRVRVRVRLIAIGRDSAIG